MTSQSIAAVEPALHGAASAAFNTSRQIGAAVGVAIFGPLLGTTHSFTTGFVTCVIVASAATTITLFLTTLATASTGLEQSLANQEPSGLVRTCNVLSTRSRLSS